MIRLAVPRLSRARVVVVAAVLGIRLSSAVGASATEPPHPPTDSPAAAAAITAVAGTPPPSMAPPRWVRVIAQATPDRVTIGDRVQYTVAVEAPPGTHIDIPLPAERIGAFDVVDFHPLPSASPGGRVRTGYRYTLTTFATGRYVLPAPSVRYRAGEEQGEVAGNEVTIEVASVVPPGEAVRDIRDIKPLVAPAFDPRPLYLGLASLAGIVLLAAGLWWALNRPRTPYTVPPPPADEVALRALDRLWARRDTWAGDWGPFYVDLSAIVRTYIEQRFGVRAPEMTTEEFLAAAGSDARLAAEHRALLGGFLQQADLVKFARARASAADAENAYRRARQFVVETGSRGASTDGGGDAV